MTNVCLPPNDDQSKKQQCFLKNCEVFRLPRTTGARIFRKILQLCGRFLFTRYKLCLCLQKRCKIETIETTFWYEFAKTRKIETHEKKWQVMEKWGNEKLWEHDETILSLMRQLKRYEQTIRGRENETIVCFYCVSCVSRGSQPFGSHSEDCTM